MYKILWLVLLFLASWFNCCRFSSSEPYFIKYVIGPCIDEFNTWIMDWWKLTFFKLLDEFSNILFLQQLVAKKLYVFCCNIVFLAFSFGMFEQNGCAICVFHISESQCSIDFICYIFCYGFIIKTKFIFTRTRYPDFIRHNIIVMFNPLYTDSSHPS